MKVKYSATLFFCRYFRPTYARGNWDPQCGFPAVGSAGLIGPSTSNSYPLASIVIQDPWVVHIDVLYSLSVDIKQEESTGKKDGKEEKVRRDGGQDRSNEEKRMKREKGKMVERKEREDVEWRNMMQERKKKDKGTDRVHSVQVKVSR